MINFKVFTPSLQRFSSAKIWFIFPQLFVFNFRIYKIIIKYFKLKIICVQVSQQGWQFVTVRYRKFEFYTKVMVRRYGTTRLKYASVRNIVTVKLYEVLVRFYLPKSNIRYDAICSIADPRTTSETFPGGTNGKNKTGKYHH